MARPLRLEFAGALYHLTARGDRREPIFLDDEDRSAFIELLAKEVRHGLAQKQVLDRSHPDAFKRAVYLLRRQANLTLNEVAALARVSPPRVSQIQAEVEGKDAIH